MVDTLRKKNLISETHNSIILIVAVIFISLFVLSRDILGFNINKFVLIGITAAFMCCLDKKEMVALMAFITPLSAGVSYNYLSAIALILFIVKSKGKIFINPAALFSICIILTIELLSSLFWEFSYVNFLIFIGIFLFSFLKMLDPSEYDNRKIVLFFIIGFWIAVISLYGQVIAEYGFSGIATFADNLDRFGNTNELLGFSDGMRVSYNPNGLGVLCMQTTLLSLLLYRIDGKFYQIILATLSVFVGITTQSRTYFLVTSASLIVFFLFNRSKSKNIGKKALVMFSSIAIIYFAVTRWLTGYLEAFSERMQADDLLNGRGEITSQYFEKFFAAPFRTFFGVGLQDYSGKYDMQMSCHNATQEILVTWGIVGLVCVILLLVVILRNIRIKNKSISDKIVFTLPFFATIIYMQAGQGFQDAASMLRMMVIVSAINLINFKQGNRINNENNSLHSNV